jgi:hypothetical protein
MCAESARVLYDIHKQNLMRFLKYFSDRFLPMCRLVWIQGREEGMSMLSPKV